MYRPLGLVGTNAYDRANIAEQHLIKDLSMSHRFFIHNKANTSIETGMQFTLDQQESHHLMHVMRASKGDQIELFDGSGFEFVAEISEMDRRTVTVEIVESREVSRELAHKICVAVPVPKSDRQKFLVEKLTEIGVDSIVFIHTERSAVKANPKTIQKLERLVIESSKQCRRNKLMRLAGPMNLTQLIENPELCFSLPESPEKSKANRQYFFAHPDGIPIRDCLTESSSQRVILIGPEGGFSETEVSLLENKSWTKCGLGPTILRMETAALVAASACST